MVTVSGRSGLTKAYVSVLSASGSWLMRGASRWLDALAVVTAGERSSAPRPSAAPAPMTDRDGALPCNFMRPSFRPPTLRTRAPERISAAPPGPFAPLPAHQSGRRAGARARQLRARRKGRGARALRAPGDPLGAHHDGGAPSGGRRPARLALHRAPGGRRGGTADLRRRRLPLLPPRRERGVSAADRPGPGADRHGQPSPRRVLRRVD